MANSINPYVMLENIKRQEAYETKRKNENINLVINTAGSIASCFIPLLTNQIKNAETTPPKTTPPVQKEEKEKKDKKIL